MALVEDTLFGRVDKVQKAIDRLRTFEPPEGYYVAMSGGKDSQTVYHLCQMAGVKFDAHYSVTGLDAPELVYFLKEHYPDVKWEYNYWNDGKPEHYYFDGRPKVITMWNLIADHTIPPTRQARYCCSALKETGGVGVSLLQVFVGLKAHAGKRCTASRISRQRAKNCTHRRQIIRPTR